MWFQTTHVACLPPEASQYALAYCFALRPPLAHGEVGTNRTYMCILHVYMHIHTLILINVATKVQRGLHKPYIYHRFGLIKAHLFNNRIFLISAYCCFCFYL